MRLLDLDAVDAGGVVVEEGALLVGGEIGHDRLEGGEDLVVGGSELAIAIAGP